MANGSPDPRGAESPEMYRWQGGIDAKLADYSRRLDAMNGDAKAARIAAEQIVIQVAVLKTKIAIWGGVGGLAGAGIVSLVVALVTGGSG